MGIRKRHKNNALSGEEELCLGVPEALTARVAQRWEQCQAQAVQEGVTLPTQAAFLRAMFRVWACSDYVASACALNPALLRDLLDSGDLLADYLPPEYADKVRAGLDDAPDEAVLKSRLRRLRRRELVRIVWRDLAGWASLPETLRDLTLLADACVDGALGKLQDWAREEYGTPRSEDGEPQSLVVLGMGKQGAFELNVSSDIDLIFAYPDNGNTDAGLTNEEFFTRLGQQLIQAIGERTQDGFVYRVDMRLRPYGESGPLAASFGALEEYYQSQGREWERYAMIKARVVAGDPQAGAALLNMLRPFVYRRYLDFGAFESLRTMKAMIQRQVQRKGMEENIKLGRGGIREIEFIGQAFQLVRGGREPGLRERGIMTVLERLKLLDYLPGYVADALLNAYRFLRRVENRLQAYADEQLHVLPRDEQERVRLAFAMGYDDWESFHRDLEDHRRVVHEHFQQVFAAPQADDDNDRGRQERALSSVWQSEGDQPQALEALEQAGFDDPRSALNLLRELRDSHAYRTIGTKGRERLDQLMPMLLGAVSATDRPNQTLLRVFNMVEAIAGRTAYLTLLVENPMALSQLVKLCGASPWIASYLAQHPILMDELLDPRTLYLPRDREDLRQELAQLLEGVAPDDLEQQMETLRHFKHSNVLRVAAADVAEAMPLMVVSDHLTYIAEVVVNAVLELVWRDLTNRHGRPGCGADAPSIGFAIVAYGKLGGFELGYGSDLDLVFLHDCPEEEQTDGERPVPNSQFFARLGQRIIHVLNTLTPSGVLYEVDMRLRPSGASGLLASNMEAFAEYQRSEAWTWEHQALARARPVAGDPRVAEQFARVRSDVLGRERDAPRLRCEVREMRERMRGELGKRTRSGFDLKQGRGGITDIEFIVQYGVLRWARRYRDLIEFTDNIRQLEALARNRLMSEDDARLLSDAYRAYRRRIHQLTLQEEPAVVEAGEFSEYREAVQRLWREWMEEGDESKS